MRIFLKVWRQAAPNAPGAFADYVAEHVSPDMSFLEMLDVLNEQLVTRGEEPVAFDHDCREGICGTCSLAINGFAHGTQRGTTACQLHMRHFRDGEDVWIEPWRAKAFPVIKDLIVDRGAFDRIIAAGGYVSARCGSAPEANNVLIGKVEADEAMDFAACIGCGACVAGCPNASAMLFVSAKISQLALLPQGRPEAAHRALNMVAAMDVAGFGNCSNHRVCEAVCPKSISIVNIARLNREYLKASLASEVA